VPLTILALLGVIYLFYRVRLLSATVAAAHFTVHTVAALDPTLPSFLSYFTTTLVTNVTVSVNPAVPHAICEFSYFPYIALLLCSMFGIFLVVRKFGCRPLNSNSFTLILEIGQQSTVIPVVAQSLPGCPNQYRFSASKFVERIAIIGRVRPSLQVTWPTLRISNTHLNMVFYLKTSIPLNIFQAFRLRQILEGSFWCMLTARYGRFAHQIDLVQPDDLGTEAEQNFSDTLPSSQPVALLVATDSTTGTPQSRVSGVLSSVQHDVV